MIVSLYTGVRMETEAILSTAGGAGISMVSELKKYLSRRSTSLERTCDQRRACVRGRLRSSERGGARRAWAAHVALPRCGGEQLLQSGEQQL